MKSLIIAIVLLMVLSAPVGASIKDNWNNWDKNDTTFQLVSSSFIVFDMWQTDIAIKNAGSEIGPASYFIGDCATTEQIVIYGIGCLSLNYICARAMPLKYRRIFQFCTVGYQYNYISESYGTKIIFRIPL